DPWSGLGILTQMSAGQLARFALFGEVRTFRHGEPVVVEGEEADGFCILLSGHLAVTAGGGQVGELSEGDVFGEMGLLQGGKRHATVRVAAADAEVLFMSTANFQALLQTLPAFSWGVRELAARRRSTDARPAEPSCSPPRGGS
ncbi:MAG TPA: cyclic nucleotide-binding domain-containing protein, partial [Candidatus Methylomirabilis sp.]